MQLSSLSRAGICLCTVFLFALDFLFVILLYLQLNFIFFIVLVLIIYKTSRLVTSCGSVKLLNVKKGRKKGSVVDIPQNFAIAGSSQYIQDS